jgi:hypothetical protein
MKPCSRIWNAGLLIFLAAVPTLAHHSFAMYDHTKTITLKGAVTKFQWTNPHAYIELDVMEKSGVKHYSIECTSINMMQRAGWRSNILKFGDQVKAVISPLNSGQPGGLLLELTLPSGKVMDPGVPAANTFTRTPEK